MRVVIIAALAMMASGLAHTALAGTSSIEQITTSRGETPSVVAITCITCPPVDGTHNTPVDTGAKLEQGTQKIELRARNGKRELVRTEAWSGGSPVVFINKEGGWLDNNSQLAGLTSDGIDSATETSAVNTHKLATDTMSLRMKPE
ncbi:plant virulence effector HPE1-like domain-containing protein [Rhizobium sp.]|jgi:hypothetical protein|uniref:plant virulence effector HPE1-like domain-containing protein n=1 Tax=Rhizobium sp. TaxID=391 RepID=UPI000E9F5D19|nr:hypothetical protein [Rhizobium sp.]